jgi:hypothetical protein
VLFENLVNSILTKDGLPKPDDFQNYPFLLAIEGRRLNGYSICLPSVIDQSPHAAELRWALDKAHTATDTAAIVKIAIELYKRLQQNKPQDKPQDKPEGKQEGKPEDKPEQGDDQGDQQDGDQQQDGQGSEQSDEQGDEQGKQLAHTGRGVEPDDFISDELSDLKCDADAQYERVIPKPPVFQTIELY